MPKRSEIEKGERHSRLTFLKEVAPYVWRGIKYRKCLWRCECGNTTEAMLSQVRRGVIKSCGCLATEALIERNKHCAPAPVGGKFNRLTVLKEVEPRDSTSGQRIRRVLCRCKCGTEKILDLGVVTRGQTKSCGCLLVESVKRRSTHGMKGTPTYTAWMAMKRRCNLRYKEDYPRYAGRGIMVCSRWEKFENFYADMGKRPSKLHTIDRIDNDLGYSKENCRWAMPLEQNNNKSNTRWITLKGKTLPQMVWVRKLGISKSALSYRLNAGWSDDDILNTPTNKNTRRK